MHPARSVIHYLFVFAAVTPRRDLWWGKGRGVEGGLGGTICSTKQRNAHMYVMLDTRGGGGVSGWGCPRGGWW